MELQREELEKLYAETFRGLHTGTVLMGTIVQVKKEGIIVNIGTKSEGFVPTAEFSIEECSCLKPGDELEVCIVDMRTVDGFVSLSKERATRLKTWELLEEAFNNGSPIEGTIVGKVKGGMTVDVGGVKAFLPGSHIDLKSPKDTDHLMGQLCPFKVLSIDSKKSNIIVSRRVIFEEQRNNLRKETLTILKEGALVNGVVKNLTDYGAFIDLGGIDGLLHISDMSWGRVSHPGELFSIGDNVKVIVLKFDPNDEKVTLGYKQKKADPWTNAEERYPEGEKVIGKVINIVDYGIFIELEEGLEGLVHVTEFDWLEKVKKPSKYFSIGDTVEAGILNVNSTDKKISLSIKQLKPNPWELINEKYSVGQKVSGKVRNLTDFGAFISLDEGIDALLHISDISWTKHINHPSEVFKKGQDVEVVILNIDTEKERISVGLKELTEDPWISEIPGKYKPGDEVKGKIIKVTEFGVFLELEDGLEGLIYSSEIEDTPKEKFDETFQIDSQLTARVMKVDTAGRKIGLTLKPTVE